VTSMMGHNRPPPDRNFKKRWVSALFAVQRKPYGSIAMAFKIYMEMDSQGRGATISDDEFRDCCGVSDGSCRVFKKWLVDNEFIRIEVRGQRGRKSTFQAVIPGEIPATYAAIDHEIPAPNTGSPEEYRRPLPAVENEIPATAAAINEPAAECAAIPASHAPAQMESLRDSYTSESEVKSPPTPQQASGPRDGEEEVSPGVFVNCETIRHEKFTISIPAIYMQLLGVVPKDEIKQIALGHAVSWANILASGKRVPNVPPNNPDNFIRASIRRQHNDDAVTDVRKKRAAGPSPTEKPKETELQRLERLMGGTNVPEQRRLT
jgi:hypothetical protein